MVGKNIYEYPYDSGTGFKFKISAAPIFTDICDLNNKYEKKHNVPSTLLKLRVFNLKKYHYYFLLKMVIGLQPIFIQ